MGVVCDHFELQASVQDSPGGAVFSYALSTDLPPGALVILHIFRLLKDRDGHELVWKLFDDEVIVAVREPGAHAGCAGSFPLDEADRNAAAGFATRRGFRATRIAASVSAVVHVRGVLHLRQRLKAFGRWNCELAGRMVQEEAHGREGKGRRCIVESAITLACPMAPVDRAAPRSRVARELAVCADEVAQGEVVDDWCSSGETMLRDGRREEGIAILREVAEIGTGNDLMHFAITRAKDLLVEVGAITLPPATSHAAALREGEFAQLSRREQDLAIAKRLIARRRVSARSEAEALRLLEACDRERPLTGRDRMKLLVLRGKLGGDAPSIGDQPAT